MTRNYNRSEIYSFSDLPDSLKTYAIRDFDVTEEDTFVIHSFKGWDTAIPLSMFMRTNRNFTHGVFADSYFSGYYVTLSRDNSEAVIAYKYF
jgi:hypothetical protein